jgi:hypothetical protein
MIVILHQTVQLDYEHFDLIDPLHAARMLSSVVSGETNCTIMFVDSVHSTSEVVHYWSSPTFSAPLSD